MKEKSFSEKKFSTWIKMNENRGVRRKETMKKKWKKFLIWEKNMNEYTEKLMN